MTNPKLTLDQLPAEIADFFGKLDLTGLDDGYVITYDAGDDKWVVEPQSGGGGHIIEDEGTPLTQRAALNFVGAGVTVTDDAGNDASVVTVNGGGVFKEP